MGATLSAWAGYAIDGVTAARHAAADDARRHARANADRVRWACFCRMWLHVGAAIQNGYRPEVVA